MDPMPMENQNQSRTQTIMAALSTLTPHQFSDLTHFLSSDFRLHQSRRLSLLLSPTHFTHTLRYLDSLSLHQKVLLIARFHLTTLKQLTRIWETQTHSPKPTSTATGAPALARLRDVDAALLLLLLCEVRHYDSQALHSSQSATWRSTLADHVFSHMFTVSGIGVSTGAVLYAYIETAARFLDAAGCGGGKAEREVAASAATVVALPSVEVREEEEKYYCVICKEEMREGRDVCELPCEHVFHWICILPWLKKRNTCPCCRFRLPTDDVFGEIERLWGIVVKKSIRNV